MLVILAVVFFVIFIAVAFYMKPQQGMLSILLGSARNLFLFVPKFSFPFILFSIETKLVGVTEPPVLDTPNEDEKKDEEEEESDHSELLEAPVLSEDEDGIVVHPPSYCS